MSAADDQWLDTCPTFLAVAVPPSSADQPYLLQRTSHVATPALWPSIVADLQDVRVAQGQKHLCLLCHEPFSAKPSKAEEHIVLQGLGQKWVKLPKGYVCSQCNSECSKAEQELLRYGPLGALRPFYSRAKKSVEFSDGSRKAIISSDPGGGFSVSLSGYKLPAEDGTGGPGSLQFQVPATTVDTQKASRALHKMGYLALAAFFPAVALESGFDEALQFINSGEGYRPYSWQFVAGAAPGVEFLFTGSRAAGPGGSQGALRQLDVRIKAHHITYYTSLLSPHQAVPGAELEGTAKPGGVSTNMTIAFRFDDIALSPNNPLQTDRPPADR